MFSKPNAIVYLRRKDLIVGGKRITSGKLTFTVDLIKNLEVLNPDVFVSTCKEFFSTHNFKSKKVQIVLDQNIVFEKNVDTKNIEKNDYDNLIKAFISQIPFEPGRRACIQDIQDDIFNIYATNVNLYQYIIDALNQSGVRKIVAVTPSAAYEIDFSVKFSVIMKMFIENKNIRKNVDFNEANVT
jgi:hypothetical protein